MHICMLIDARELFWAISICFSCLFYAKWPPTDPFCLNDYTHMMVKVKYLVASLFCHIYRCGVA